nr:putative ribonuclease H-like domain-containing protein [Tanacetum cinerariifolium]
MGSHTKRKWSCPSLDIYKWTNQSSPPKTAEEILARERERKARTTLLMVIPEDHLAKFHKMTNAKEIWEAIKSKFGRNNESKKMQKYLLKQQFKSFSVSNSEGLHKGYDRFQSLMSQLETHGVGVSIEDANQKFLRSLPSTWSQVSLIMRTKLGVDTLSFDDLYNNLRVVEFDVKGSTGSSSSTQNVAFVSSDNTSSTNEDNTDCVVSTSSGHNSQKEGSSSYNDELMYSFFTNQSSGPQLDHEDLEQVDEFDLEEMDLKWQVAMISTRLKKFYKKTGRKLYFDTKEPVGFDKSKVKECKSKGNQDSKRRDAENTRYKARDNEKRPAKQDEHKDMVTIDGEGVDWTGHAEDDTEDYALMAFNSSNPGSDTEVTSCSKVCEKSYAKLKKLYDEQREQLGDASIEIQAYTLALKKVEAQLVCHQENQLAYEEKIRFMKIDLDDKTNVLIYHKKLLAEAEKEKEELKTKHENFQSSSNSLSKLLNSQMSANDKYGLGYESQIHDGVLSYENEVFASVFDSRSSDVKDSHVNDRFAKVKGIHAVPPPMTGNYMASKSDFGINESKFTYGPKQSTTSESDSKTSDLDSCNSSFREETLETMPKPVESKPKVINKPKVWSDAPIIEEYESDSDDEYVSNALVEQDKPTCAFINIVKHVKTLRQTIQDQDTCSQNPKVDQRDSTDLKSKRIGLGYGYTKKACFVCGSFSHLIKDCDFHKKRMAKHVELNEGKNKPITTENKANKTAGPKETNNSAANNRDEKLNEDTDSKTNEEPIDHEDQAFLEGLERITRQEQEANDAAKTLRKTLEDIYEVSIDGILTNASYDYEDTVADFTNLETTMNHCLFACFLSQIEPKKISQALEDESWVDAMQEELLQFKIQQIWILVDLPFGKKVIRTKWVYRNKKDERGVVVSNKAMLVSQGHRQEEWIDYDDVFALVARIEAIRIFLVFASYIGFIVYQMDVKSAFLYGKINEEVYVSQPPGFIDPKFPHKVYKVVKALYGLHQALRAWYATLSTFLVQSGYIRGLIDKTLFIKKDKKDIMLVQVYFSLGFQTNSVEKSSSVRTYLCQCRYGCSTPLGNAFYTLYYSTYMGQMGRLAYTDHASLVQRQFHDIQHLHRLKEVQQRHKRLCVRLDIFVLLHVSTPRCDNGEGLAFGIQRCIILQNIK